jgi:CheY-like chemotaxis protein
MTAILIVEDNPLNLQLVRDILEHRGHQVRVATCVDEARAQLRVGRPALVLLDIRIPGGGGELVLEEIRAEPSMVGLQVIAVTAQSMAGDRERLLACGFDGYVSKPIDTRAFGPMIEAFLSLRS